MDLLFSERAVSFYFLGVFVSDAFFPDLSAWTWSFSSFRTLLKHHVLTGADLPRAAFVTSSRLHIMSHTSVKVLLIATGTLSQPLSEPLDCMDWILFFLLLQVPAFTPFE